MANVIQIELSNDGGLFSVLTRQEFDLLFSEDDDWNERLTKVRVKQDLVNILKEFQLEKILEGSSI